MKDIVLNIEDDEYIKSQQMIELLKKNTEIKKKRKGEPYGVQEKIHYETPENLWRDTLAIETNKDNIFTQERDAFIKNFNEFLGNMDTDDKDPTQLQEQVDR